MAESQPINISTDKLAEATEDSQIICNSHNCVDVVSNLDVTEVNYENDGMVNMQNVDEDDKFLKCEDNKEVFVQEESLKDTSIKKFKSCIESDDCGHVGTMNLEDNTKDVVEVKDKDGLEINYSSYVAKN